MIKKYLYLLSFSFCAMTGFVMGGQTAVPSRMALKNRLIEMVHSGQPERKKQAIALLARIGAIGYAKSRRSVQ